MMVARKRIAAIALLLVITVGIAFAAPLKAAAGFGDAKIYDNTYRIVRNPSQVSDGYVIKTAGDRLVLSGDGIRIAILPDSLARVISIGSRNELYLLDGKAEVNAEKAFTVKTTAINYRAEGGATLYVITDEKTETAYVESRSAIATNLITGKVTLMAPGTYIDSMGNAVTVDPSFLEQKTVPESPEAETPAVEAAEPETPATESEPMVETERVMMSRTITYQGFDAIITASEGTAVAEYPAFVTDQEVLTALQTIYAPYPEIIENVTLMFGGPGTLYAYYPAEYGEDGFNYAFGILERELPPYIDNLMALFAAQAAEAEAKTEEEEKAPETEILPLVWTFDYRGIKATVTAYPGKADVTYPAAITNNEIDTAVAALVATYPEYTAGITYDILRPGLATLCYPDSYGPDEFTFAAWLIDAELQAYIDWIADSKKPQMQEGTITAPEKPEPASEPAQPASTTTPIEISPRPVEQEQSEEPAEEKSFFSFGLSIGASAGFGTDGDYYYAPDFINRRIGMFAKNLDLSIEPSFRLGNFTLGLRLHARIKDGRFIDPFTFNPNGRTNLVHSIAQYISLIRLYTDNGVLSIDAERNSELDFSSAIHDPYKIDYDKEDRLTFTGALRIGGFTLAGFIEDLEYNNKLAGRSDYSGVRLSFESGDVEVGLSTIVDFKHGLEHPILYPGVDFRMLFRLGSQEFDFNAQATAQIEYGKFNALVAKATFDTIFGKHLVFGLGAAYNHNQHINDLMNNGPVEILRQFSGNSIDAILRAGLVFGPFSIVGKFVVPFSLNKDGDLLAYNVARTRNNRERLISADTMDAKAELEIGTFRFSTGVILNGFSGKTSDFIKAIINRTDVVKNLKAYLDPEVATYYALITYSTEIEEATFSAFSRIDLTRVGGYLTIPFSTGFGISF